MIYILKKIYEIKEDIGKGLNLRTFKRSVLGLENIKESLDNLCLIKYRKNEMTKLIKDKKSELANKTQII